ncbi:unnamed protein product [Rotaria sp. Silwood1]|nr:unnamed protein product [Rotaria sp. Silwood1]CAF0905340.1 unnamed protein product [Rotaria sp. Silwood1]CAF3374170.1 unnamed protein product [Rotaria sp. Silwood1]CAF4492331.1 unnamed protein product [Rotaria sp. Silwood1]
MADLDDIGIELKDTDEQSIDIIQNCPSPPAPFHRPLIEQGIIIQPPVTFNDQEQVITLKNIVPFDNIFFNDAKLYLFQTIKNNSSTLNETKRKSEKNFFQRFINFFRSAMISHHTLELNRQCEELLLLTTYPCNMSDRVHIRILYTIYRRLTNSKEIFYTTLGPHWEDIGFQTSNPETDFRSTGLFSIFFLLYFVDSMYLPLAKQIYQFSHDEKQQFPFCCIGINLANIVIKYLRRIISRMNVEKLIDEKQTDHTAIDLSGKLFIALFLNFYLKWKDNFYTIESTQQVLHELEQLIMNRPKILLEEFDNYFQRKQIQNKHDKSGQYEFKSTNENLV